MLVLSSLLIGLPGYSGNIPSALEIHGANQQRAVKGVVVDESGEAIAGANVVVKGSTIGTQTDMDGNYAIENIAPDAVLQFSYIGYRTQEIRLSGRQNPVNIILEEDLQALDEVVVVGYGTQKKVNLTGAVQSVSSEELTRRKVANTSVALQGLMPGVAVTQSSGAPGSEASIQIRGTGSINTSTSPLILIDGVEGDMNSIDMESIESISVLKDAASASIYGSRASNGVILVTTKRAKNDGVKVAYSGFVGLRTPTEMPDPTNALEYMEAVNVARANADMEPQYSEETLNKYRTEGADNVHSFDTRWRDLLFKDAMLTHNHSLSLSGGSERIKAFVNAGYNYEDGLIPNNRYNRKTLRTNTDAKITGWLSASLDIHLRQTVFDEPSASAVTIIQEALTYTPVFSGINADGTWGVGQNGVNPIAQAEAGGTAQTIHNDMNVKGSLMLNPAKGLDFLASYSTRRYENKAESYTATYDTYEGGTFQMSYPTTGNSKSESWAQYTWNQFNMQGAYETTLAGKHYLKAFAGLQAEEVLSRSFSAGRKNFEYDGYNDLMHGDVSTATASGSKSERAIMSYMARVNYAFADRYLLELNGRYDGSSRFADGHRWGFFPSASIGWRISEEPFFAALKSKVENLKLRASYGTLGNQSLSSQYPYASTLSSGAGYWFNDTYTTGVYASSMANANISWEKSTQANFGLDASLLNSHLGITFDYYIRNITDMLQTFPVPLYVGLSSSWENAGSMRNNGWDLSLAWRDKAGKVKYNITVNVSDVKNEITDLYGNEYINSNNTTQEGYPIYSWYGYVADGYFQSQEEIDASPVYGGVKENVKPGYIRYKDLNNDGKIDDEDRTIIGDPQTRYSYSANFGAEWNNFDLSVFLQGVGKKDIYFEGAGARPFYVGRTIYREQLDYWTPDNRDAAYPLLLIDGSGTNMNNIPSSFWVRSGAYLRVKNVSIGYTIPKNIAKKWKVDNLRLYVSGQNLLTLSDAYDGYDPETSVSNFYPVMQIYTFGINFSF